MSSWEELFRTHTVAEVREKHSSLLAEKDSFQDESSSALGAAYPEILSLCAQIHSLSETVLGPENALMKLSSVENSNQWRRTSENVNRYHKQERAQAQNKALDALKTSLLAQINALVAEGELLAAARTFYLLTELSDTPTITVLDKHLKDWLAKSSTDHNAIVAYILRFKVPPTVLGRRLAEHRLEKLKTLSVIEGIDLLDQTVFSLDYIADYQLKFRKSSAKLVDSLNIDTSILPESALNLPLYPEQCFTPGKAYERSEFVTAARKIIYDNVTTYLQNADAKSAVSLFSTLTRDSPGLTEQTHELFVKRLEVLIEETSSNLDEITVPEKSEQQECNILDPMAVDIIIMRTKGQCGSLELAVEKSQEWRYNIEMLKGQLEHFSLLSSRSDNIEGDNSSLIDSLDRKSEAALDAKLERLKETPNYGNAIIIVRALRENASQLTGLYTGLADSLIKKWTLVESDITLAPFPSRGLMRSLSELVNLMDSVAVGFVWTAEACDIIRNKAYEVLQEKFSEEISFVDALFGKSDDSQSKATADRVRVLLAPLAVM